MIKQIFNCGSVYPSFPRWKVGTPCLLVETRQGLVLVDTGMGEHDYLHPAPVVWLYTRLMNFAKDTQQTVNNQLSSFGYRPEDIQHIILTHLHFDHAGGLPEFPHAQIHVHRNEYRSMLHPRRWIELAYDKADFSHHPDWILYDEIDSNWLGWDAIRLPFSPEMYFIPLFGHTSGHCGVVIRDSNGWVFQCGDALPTNADYDITPDWLNRLVIGPHVPKIKDWAADHPEVRILAGHMWESFFNR